MNGNGGSDKSYPLEPQDMSWIEKTEGEYETRYRDILRPAITEKPKSIRIQVTVEDIEAGVRNIVSNSPVTIAIKRASRIPGDVIPMWTIVRIGPTWYQISQTAQRAVQQFDSGKKIKPFSFNLVPLPDIDFLANPDRLGYTKPRITGGYVRVARPGLAKRTRAPRRKSGSVASRGASVKRSASGMPRSGRAVAPKGRARSGR